MIELLPGRIAILIPDRKETGIVSMPASVRKFMEDSDSPWLEPMIGYIVARNESPKCRVSMPDVGSTVWVQPNSGITFEPNDLDCPTVGALVPEGHRLRIMSFGWQDDIYGVDEDGFPSGAAIGMIKVLNPELAPKVVTQ